MKNSNAKIALVCSFLLAAFLAAYVCVSQPVRAVAYADGEIYDKLNDEVIALYESEIAKDKVVTNQKQKTITSLADKNGFTVKKVQALLLLSDLSGRVGDKKTFVELAKLPDLAILVFGKKCVDKYAKTLSKERQEELKILFLNSIKQK